MRRRFEAASETVADEASLLLADGPGALAESLLKLGTQFAHHQPSRSLGIAVTGFRSSLGRRVERLVHLKGRAWRPPGAANSIIARTAAALVLVLTTILCTAWTVPAALTKGENMQTMQHAWKRSLAAFAMMTTLGTGSHTLIAGEPVDPASTPVVDGIAARNPADPRQGQTLAYRSRPGAAANTPADANQFAPSEAATASKERLEVEAKLKRIKLDTIAYDGVPLIEVVRHLGDSAAKLDPEKVGINFLIRLDTQPSPAGMPGAIDPTTGLPVAAVPTESVDLNSVIVKIEPPLKQVRLCDVLDAITKVADRPIKYTVEDYGVVFSLDQSRLSGSSLPLSIPAPEPVFVRTFKVDTNTFAAGLEATFGIGIGFGSKEHDFQGALRELLVKLGVNVDAPNKSIFYNKLTGILMVRGTQEDLSLVQAAVETLGGSEYSTVRGSPGFDGTAGTGARP